MFFKKLLYPHAFEPGITQRPRDFPRKLLRRLRNIEFLPDLLVEVIPKQEESVKLSASRYRNHFRGVGDIFSIILSLAYCIKPMKVVTSL